MFFLHHSLRKLLLTIIDQLRVNSELIQGINNQFRDHSESLEIVSFYESKGIHGVGVYIQSNINQPAYNSSDSEWY
jgi:hypothetical protein